MEPHDSSQLSNHPTESLSVAFVMRKHSKEHMQSARPLIRGCRGNTVVCGKQSFHTFATAKNVHGSKTQNIGASCRSPGVVELRLVEGVLFGSASSTDDTPRTWSSAHFQRK